jgi:hypothetical protein
MVGQAETMEAGTAVHAGTFPQRAVPCLHTTGKERGRGPEVEPSNSSWERGEVSREMKQGEEMKD